MADDTVVMRDQLAVAAHAQEVVMRDPYFDQHGPAPEAVVSRLVRRCNLHEDCDYADAAVREVFMSKSTPLLGAYHCHDPNCPDCR